MPSPRSSFRADALGLLLEARPGDSVSRNGHRPAVLKHQPHGAFLESFEAPDEVLLPVDRGVCREARPMPREPLEIPVVGERAVGSWEETSSVYRLWMRSSTSSWADTWRLTWAQSAKPTPPSLSM